MNAKDFSYLILEKEGITSSAQLDWYRKSFEMWKSTWKNIFEQVGSPQAYQIDDFFRQDLIALITQGDEIVGAHLYTKFDLQNPAVPEMRYFSIFDERAMAKVRQDGKQGAMSMEFLMVNPKWRNNGAGFSFAEVLIALAFEVMASENLGVALGVAVKAAKVDQLAIGLHCEVIARDAKRGNLVCDIVSQTPARMRPHRNPETQAFITGLWNKRIYSNSRTQPHKKAA